MSEKHLKEQNFGTRVLALRKAMGLSQIGLAKKIGSSKGTIQNYEAGTLPKGEYAINLARIFKCSIDWLLTGEDFISKDKNAISKKDDIIVIEHCDLVKEFGDQPRAKKINQNLLKIEKRNKQAFRDVDNYIEGVANGLEYAAPGEAVEDESQDQQKKIS